jgi:hypothetical protein
MVGRATEGRTLDNPADNTKKSSMALEETEKVSQPLSVDEVAGISGQVLRRNRRLSKELLQELKS